MSRRFMQRQKKVRRAAAIVAVAGIAVVSIGSVFKDSVGQMANYYVAEFSRFNSAEPISITVRTGMSVMWCVENSDGPTFHCPKP